MPQQEKEKNAAPELRSDLLFNERHSDKVAIIIADVFGSLWFLIFCVAFFAVWIGWNLGSHSGHKPFDPYPFAGLEMVVSVFAIILSISVLISQKRQGRQQKINQQVEFEVNIRAEDEITEVLRMLHAIQDKLGIHGSNENLEEMKKHLDVGEIHKQMDENEK